MGRVDDAMRRAAEAARQKNAPGAASADDVTTYGMPLPVDESPAAEAVMGSDIAAGPTGPAMTDAATEPFVLAQASLRLAGPAVTGRDRVDAIASPPRADLAVPTNLALPAEQPRATAKPSALFQHMDAGLAAKIVVDQQMLPGPREQYRRLAAALHNGQEAGGLRVVMIASAVASEGKTLTASNLALTLSESYQRNVLLIDADLRRPSLHRVFKIPGAPGLVEGLTSLDEQRLPLHQVSTRLTILPAGEPSEDPMAGLTSARMKRLLDEAREAFHWIIIDTPPVGLLTDANLLASMVDATILVVKAGSTPFDLVKRAVEAIGAPRVFGVVLNRAEPDTRGYGYDYSGYTRYATRTAIESAR